MSKIRTTFLILSLAVCPIISSAQTAILNEAQTLIDKKQYDDAIAKLEDAALKVKNDPKKVDYKKLAALYNKAGEAALLPFNQELIKASQQAPLDTVAFIKYLDKASTSFITSEIADKTPDEKGRVKPQFHARNMKVLTTMTSYFNYAAIFLYQNGKKQGAAEYFKKYIDFRTNETFSPAQQDSILAADKKQYNEAAFNILVIYYEEKMWDEVLKNADLALANEEAKGDVYSIKSEACLAKKDTALYISTLKEAISNVKNNTNYISQLLDLYIKKENKEGAYELADQLIKQDPNNRLGWYVKGNVLMNMDDKYAEARENYLKAIAIDANYMEANVNIAYTYINEAIEARKNKKSVAEYKKFFQDALPYSEKARSIAPTEVKVWGNQLSMIYSNLQMLDKAKEIEDLMK